MKLYRLMGGLGEKGYETSDKFEGETRVFASVLVHHRGGEWRKGASRPKQRGLAGELPRRKIGGSVKDPFRGEQEDLRGIWVITEGGG